MNDIATWTEGQKDEFCHKLEELIHGPDPRRKIGFLLITFPVQDSSRASVQSNCSAEMNIKVLYEVLKGLMQPKIVR